MQRGANVETIRPLNTCKIWRKSVISLEMGRRMCQEQGEVNRGFVMLKTIMIGKDLSIQGKFVRTTPNGLMVVRVGDKTYAGRPANRRVA